MLSVQLRSGLGTIFKIIGITKYNDVIIDHDTIVTHEIDNIVIELNKCITMEFSTIRIEKIVVYFKENKNIFNLCTCKHNAETLSSFSTISDDSTDTVDDVTCNIGYSHEIEGHVLYITSECIKHYNGENVCDIVSNIFKIYDEYIALCILYKTQVFPFYNDGDTIIITLNNNRHINIDTIKFYIEFVESFGIERVEFVIDDQKI